MKKLVLFVAMAMVVAFSSCSKKTEATNPEVTNQSVEQTEQTAPESAPATDEGTANEGDPAGQTAETPTEVTE